MRQRGLDDPERRVDVCLHRRVELFSGDIENGGLRLLPSGIADKNIEPAETMDRLSDELLTKSFGAQVAGNRQSNPPLGLDQRDYLASIFFLFGQIINRHV